MNEAPGGWHIAEINIARALRPLDGEWAHQFTSQLDAVNRQADEAEGFVWRLVSPTGGPYVQFDEDPLVIVNMSVWTSLEPLRSYVYRSGHAAVYRDRQLWFALPTASPFALWWIRAGERPTLEEGRRRLETLHRLGSTAEAFTFRFWFPPPQNHDLEY